MLNTLAISSTPVSFIKFPKMVVNRALRSLPLILFINICLIAMPLFSGPGPSPLYNQAHRGITLNCIQNGWRDLLFMQDSIPLSKMCNISSWFVAVDMKLFIVSSLVLLATKEYVVFGIFAVLLQFIIGVMLHIRQLSKLDVPVLLFTVNPIADHDPIESSHQTYFPWEGFLAVSSVASIAGLILHWTREKILPQMNILMTVLSLIGCLVFMQINMRLYDEHGRSLYSRSTQVLVAALIRPLFASCVFSAAYFSLFRWKPLLNILSSQFFTVLSRLHYSTYMSHLLVIFYIQIVQQDVLDYMATSGLLLFINTLILSLPLGFMVAVLFEIPAKNLIAHFMRFKHVTSFQSKQE
jgi:hypothetical protein